MNMKQSSSITVTINGEKVIKDMTDFFDSKDEALKNPYEVITLGEIEGSVRSEEKLDLTMRFSYVKTSKEEDWLLTIKSYGKHIFESFYLLKMLEDGMYLVHANYDGMDKYMAFRQRK